MNPDELPEVTILLLKNAVAVCLTTIIFDPPLTASERKDALMQAVDLEQLRTFPMAPHNTIDITSTRSVVCTFNALH